MMYLSKGVNSVFPSKETCRDLGIITDKFPLIADHVTGRRMNPIENFNEHGEVKSCAPIPLSPGVGDENDDTETKSCDNDAKQFVFNKDDLEYMSCGCPKREIAPEAPENPPFPATVKNIPKLEKWIKSYYATRPFINHFHL